MRLNQGGSTVLSTSLEHKILLATVGGELAKIQWLVQSCGPEERIDFTSLLTIASRNNCQDVVEYYIEQGADVSVENHLPIRYAAMNGNLNMVKYLEAYGSDLHVLNENPLQWAVINENWDMVLYLVSKGADVNADSGEILILSVAYERHQMTEYLLNQGANLDLSIKTASRNEQVDVANHLRIKKEQRELESEVITTESKMKARL